MQARKPKLSLLPLLTLWLVFGWLPIETQADHRSKRIRSGHGARTQPHVTSHRPPPRAPIQQPRRLLPPAGLGSATNAPPGFYQQLNAPRVHPSAGHGHGHHRHGIPAAPVYVYLEAPPVYVESPPPLPAARQPVANPRPVVIVQPPAPAPAPVAPPAPVSAPAPAPRPTGPSAVRFSIQPPDAEVFLNDDYLGTGTELAALGESLLPSGVHVLEVSHPDHRPQRLIFGVGGQAPTHVLIDLAAERIGRRSKIR